MTATDRDSLRVAERCRTRCRTRPRGESLASPWRATWPTNAQQSKDGSGPKATPVFQLTGCEAVLDTIAYAGDPRTPLCGSSHHRPPN
jgi:hypothetical protein